MTRHFHILTAFATIFMLMGLTAQADYRKDTQKKLKTIVIPQMAFEDAPVRDVIAFLRARAKDLDIEGEGVNVIFQCKKEALDAPVTVDFTNLPLGEAIRYVCMGSGLNYKVEKHAIVVSDGTNDKDRMEMRVFHIDAGVMSNAHNRKGNDFSVD